MLTVLLSERPEEIFPQVRGGCEGEHDGGGESGGHIDGHVGVLNPL